MRRGKSIRAQAVFCGAGAALLLLGAPGQAEAGDIFWADQGDRQEGTGTLRTVNLNGTGFQDVLTGLSRPIGVALDVPNQHVYVGVGGFGATPGSIRRVGFNGSNPVTLVSGAANLGADQDVQHIRLDLAGGKMYWASYHQGLRRANLDGSNVELVQAGGATGDTRGHLAIQGGTLYAGSASSNNVYQSPLTAPGTFTDVPVDTVGANDMALNATGTLLYWPNAGGSIQSNNLAGTDLQTLVTGLAVPLGVALTSDNRIIWTERGGTRIAIDDINPNTPSNPQLVFAAQSPFGIAVVPEPGTAMLLVLAGGSLLMRRRRKEA